MNHIVICSTSFPSQSTSDGKDAAGSFVAEFAKNLAKNNLVTVVAPGLTNDVTNSGNLSVHRFAVASLPLSLLTIKNPKDWLTILSTLKRGQSALESVVIHNKPAHIFALWALPSGYWAMKLSKKYNIPFSIWALGSDIWSLGKIPLIRSVLSKTLNSANHRFADGYDLCREVEQLCNSKCGFLPSSRKLSQLPTNVLANKPPYNLAFLGRWHHNKGVDLLLEALLKMNDKDWSLISEIKICGGGPMEDIIRNTSNVLISAGRPIVIGGFLNLQEASSLYNWADYLLIPSRIESIPVVFSDAMQARCPVIAMPVGDLPELVRDNRVGKIAHELTSDAFREAICDALQTPPIDFEKATTSMSKKFSSEQAVAQFIEHIGLSETVQ
jgi:glycosyltransferase involved in cell wall biosynthesis